MAKALVLSDDTLDTVPPVPKAAQHVSAVAKTAAPKVKAATVPTIPLQLRLPAEDVKAIKLAAITGEFESISAFMLACFQAYKPSVK